MIPQSDLVYFYRFFPYCIHISHVFDNVTTRGGPLRIKPYGCLSQFGAAIFQMEKTNGQRYSLTIPIGAGAYEWEVNGAWKPPVVSFVCGKLCPNDVQGET